MIEAPGHHFVLLENGRVRVLDTRVEPGERTPVHAHEWPAALYVLSWSDFVRYDPDGNVLLDSRSLATKPAVGSALWGGLDGDPLRDIGLLAASGRHLRLIMRGGEIIKNSLG